MELVSLVPGAFCHEVLALTLVANSENGKPIISAKTHEFKTRCRQKTELGYLQEIRFSSYNPSRCL